MSSWRLVAGLAVLLGACGSSSTTTTVDAMPLDAIGGIPAPDATPIDARVIDAPGGPDATTMLAAGVYGASGDPMQIIVPANTLPADWSPEVDVLPAVSATLDDPLGFDIQTGEIYRFSSEGLLANPVWIQIPWPALQPNDIFVAMEWDAVLNDWIFVPHEIDTVNQLAYIEARDLAGAYTTAIISADDLNGEAATIEATEVDLLAALRATIDPAAGELTMFPGRLVTTPPSPNTLAMQSLYQATSQALLLSALNAAQTQQSMNAIQQAATTQGVATLYSLDTAALAVTPSQLYALTSGAAGAPYLPGSDALDPAHPCANGACTPGGTCVPTGTEAVCMCDANHVASGLTCGVRNQPPTVAVAPAVVVTVFQGGNVMLSVRAVDPEGTAVTVSWSAAQGQFDTTAGSTVTYTPPSTPGNYDVLVTAVDATNVSTTIPIWVSVRAD